VKLPGIAKRHERRTDDELRAALEAGREELREFRRAHQVFRDRAHAAVDGSIEAGQRWLEAELSRFATIQRTLEPVRGPNGQLPPVVQYAAAAALPALAETWHALVDQADGFSELTHEQFLADERKRVAAIAELEAELARRVIAERQAADERELAELEASVP